MAGKINDDKVRCSFCGKSQQQVRKLIAGPNGAYICDECVEICAEIIDEELEEAGPREHKGGAPDFEINLLTPEEMKAMSVDGLRRLARELEIPSMTRAEIRYAKKQELIQKITEFIDS